jgi:hypothetical protein
MILDFWKSLDCSEGLARAYASDSAATLKWKNAVGEMDIRGIKKFFYLFPNNVELAQKDN